MADRLTDDLWVDAFSELAITRCCHDKRSTGKFLTACEKNVSPGHYKDRLLARIRERLEQYPPERERFP